MQDHTAMSPHLVTAEQVETTIAAFTRLDQRGDKKAMNRLAQRLQKEQPFLLERAAALRNQHGDTVGEAAVFYVTLMWAMFDRSTKGTLPRLTAQNLTDADAAVSEVHASDSNPTDLPVHQRVPQQLVDRQPNIYAKLAQLLTEDLAANAVTPETVGLIMNPVEVVIEAFDAALTGRRPGQPQGTIVVPEKIGRNEPCTCGSGKKYKRCHGEA